MSGIFTLSRTMAGQTVQTPLNNELIDEVSRHVRLLFIELGYDISPIAGLQIHEIDQTELKINIATQTGFNIAVETDGTLYGISIFNGDQWLESAHNHTPGKIEGLKQENNVKIASDPIRADKIVRFAEAVTVYQQKINGPLTLKPGPTF